MYIYSLLASFYWLFITQLDDEAFGYLKRVIVTPAVYPRLVEFLHFDIQSTGQKSHCVNTELRPSQCYVLIRQSDSPCQRQFLVGSYVVNCSTITIANDRQAVVARKQSSLGRPAAREQPVKT